MNLLKIWLKPIINSLIFTQAEACANSKKTETLFMLSFELPMDLSIGK